MTAWPRILELKSSLGILKVRLNRLVTLLKDLTYDLKLERLKICNIWNTAVFT